MITSSTGLGWNPLHALKNVARNPLVQNVAKAEANQYAPGAYSQAASAVDQARAVYRAGQQPGPTTPGSMQPGGKTHDHSMPDGGGGPPAGAQNSHILVYGLIGVGVVAALLMMRQ